MIYFLQHPNTRIKIGTTTALAHRKTVIEREQGCSLVLLGIMSGSYMEEKELHSRFSDCREFKEWFLPADDLTRFISEHAEPWNGEKETTSKTVRLDLSREDHELLEGLAEERGLSMASFVRMILKERMNELPSPKKPKP